MKMKCLFPLLMLLFFTFSGSFATTYYVSTSGSDSNSGTSGSPWRTLSHALSQVASNQGHTIQLSAGTFIENDILTFEGISLIGAGSNLTTIRVNSYFNIEESPVTKTQGTGNHYDPSPQEFVFQVDGDNVTMKGFEMDGQNNQCHGGIRGIILNDATFEDLYIHDFNFSGLWTQVANDTEIKNSRFIDNAWGNGVRAFGNIIYYAGENLSIHHNTIIQSDEYGSYGICAQNQERDVFLGSSLNHEPIPGTPSPGYLINLKIYNNYIDVPEYGSWNNYTAPSISIQINSTKILGMEIYNNWLNNHLSITPGTIPAEDKGKPKCHIHHNVIDMYSGSEYRYAIEANVPDMEMNNNYIIGGLYPIAQWEANRPEGLWENHNIHHNIFYGQRQNKSIIRYRHYPVKFRFVNNAIIDNSSEGISNYIYPRGTPPYDAPGGIIRNNLF